MTHWHPDPEEMPEELRDIGTRGCILVVRRYLLGEAVGYMGPESDCPPRCLRKGLLFRRLVLKAQ